MQNLVEIDSYDADNTSELKEKLLSANIEIK